MYIQLKHYDRFHHCNAHTHHAQLKKVRELCVCVCGGEVHLQRHSMECDYTGLRTPSQHCISSQALLYMFKICMYEVKECNIAIQVSGIVLHGLLYRRPLCSNPHFRAPMQYITVQLQIISGCSYTLTEEICLRQ